VKHKVSPTVKGAQNVISYRQDRNYFFSFWVKNPSNDQAYGFITSWRRLQDVIGKEYHNMQDSTENARLIVKGWDGFVPVEGVVDHHDLMGRISLPGEITGADIQRTYEWADVARKPRLLLTERANTESVPELHSSGPLFFAATQVTRS
jgi:hypothetical protein